MRRDENRLLAEFPDTESTELVPTGGERFVCFSGTERLDLSFARGKDGAVESVKLVQRSLEIRAAKME